MAGNRESLLRSTLAAVIAAAGNKGLDMELLSRDALARLFDGAGDGRSEGKRISAAVEELELAVERARKL